MITLDDPKFDELKTYIQQQEKKDYPESYLIAVLHKTQSLFGYVPREAMDFIAEEMSIPTAHIWGVVTFYHYFNLTPPGKHVVSVCLGTACYVKGANQILQRLKDDLKIEVGEVTEDGLFSLEGARCLGACGLAPVVMIDDKIYGDLTPDKMSAIITKLRKESQKEK